MNSAKDPIVKQADETLHREIKDHEEVKEIVEDNIGKVNEACNNSDAIVEREQELQKEDLEPSRDDNVVDDVDDDDGFFPRKLFLFKIDRFKQKEEGPCNADLGSCNVASPTRRQDFSHSDDVTVAAMKDEMTRKIRKFFGFK
ncbi:uncharacterized protein LOC130047294 [Ostrea edulis]|uniref:uncharacterized protein LOC130047294 n=1 Tax=Ostrea edulis TaxID=37623 RepID=UPI0024AF2D33|nr:uncharacterized protein LOC130047294 [Ostrea edulis]